MRFLPLDPEVTLYETVFEDDILERAKVSKSLSDLLDRIKDPLVVALDGRWGTGKSYFLKRWVGAHRGQNNGRALTLYFDAFANDYQSDPLVALVAALSERVPAAERPKLDAMKKVALSFAKPLTKIALNLITLGAQQQVGELADAIADVANGGAQEMADKFWEREEGRQQGMQAFRDGLEQLIKGDEGAEPTPLVIVIDELDRCRPDYALEVLEVIKHFFAVPMVHFVLGVNLKAMENSVKARYGHEIDATSYLQKFISLTVSLPDQVGQHNKVPAVLAYAQAAAREMGLPKEYIEEIVERQLPVVVRKNAVSIRDVGKILGAVAILHPEALNPRLYGGWRALTVSLIIARVIRKDVFEKMIAGDLSKADLAAYIDATPENVARNLPDGGHNPNYDHPTWFLHAIWNVLLFNGEDLIGEDLTGIRRLFDQFGDTRNARSFPRRTLDDWMNTFSFAETKA